MLISPARPTQRSQSPPDVLHAGTVRARAIVLALFLIPLDSLWIIQMERIRAGPFPTTISLFANAVFVLAVLVLMTRAAPRFRLLRGLALTQAELLLVYFMVAFSGALAGLDMMPILIQMLSTAYWFAPGRSWLKQFGPYLPKQLMVSDLEVLRGYYGGNSTLYTRAHLVTWLPPALAWSAVVAVMLFVMMCLNTLVRKQWADRERLTFPLVTLPLEMTDPVGRLWRNPLMWAGFAFAGGIDFINGIAFLYPSIPEIVVKHVDVRPMFPNKPWSAMGFTAYSLYPFAVGIGFLLPVDLLFSCWFFYLFWKLQLVISSAAGYDITPDFPFVKEQAFGGYMAILLFLMWTGRGYLREVWKRVLGTPAEIDDAAEGLSYRAAFAGAVAGFLALTAFMAWLGLRWWIAALAWGIYFALSVAVTRMRAELGPPVHDLHFSGPDSLLTRAWGTNYFSPRDLTVLNFFWWHNRAYRSHPMPHGMEALRGADRTGANRKIYFWSMVAAGAFGALAVFWAYLHLSYIYGSASKIRSGYSMAQAAYSRLDGWIKSPEPGNAMANWAVVVGFAFCCFLAFMRINYFWWPFHPIGYAISGSWAINLVWMPLFIAWLLKLLVLRYGGLRLYRTAVPFFLGLILGQCIVGSLWSLIGIALDLPTYSFWGG
jgi:hypothetical protein